MRRKLFAIVLGITAVLAFSACGSNQNTSGNNSNNSSAASDSTPVSEPPSLETKTVSLEDWIGSADCKDAEDSTNDALSGTGMTVKLNADSNVFIYEYYLKDDGAIDYSSLTADQLDAAFGPVIEANRSDLNDLFTSFEQSYDITLDAIRFTFYTADGTELYTGEVHNE